MAEEVIVALNSVAVVLGALGKEVAGLAANRAEQTAGEDGRASKRERADSVAGLRIEARSHAVADVERREVLARLSADGDEFTAGVDGGARNHQGGDGGVNACIRVPTRGAAVGHIERSNLVACLAPNGGEKTAGIN